MYYYNILAIRCMCVVCYLPVPFMLSTAMHLWQFFYCESGPLHSGRMCACFCCSTLFANVTDEYHKRRMNDRIAYTMTAVCIKCVCLRREWMRTIAAFSSDSFPPTNWMNEDRNIHRNVTGSSPFHTHTHNLELFWPFFVLPHCAVCPALHMHVSGPGGSVRRHARRYRYFVRGHSLCA